MSETRDSKNLKPWWPLKWLYKLTGCPRSIDLGLAWSGYKPQPICVVLLDMDNKERFVWNVALSIEAARNFATALNEHCDQYETFKENT